MKKLIITIIALLLANNSWAVSISGGAGISAPYLGQFANNAVICSSTIAAGTQTQGLMKKHFFARDSVSSFQIAYPNWYINSSHSEAGNGGAATIKAAIEYPLGVTLTRVLWSGVDNIVIANNTQGALSDVINVAIPDGAEFIVRTYITNASGVIVSQQGSEQSQDTANGEEYRFATSGLTDQTMTLGVFTGGGTSTTLTYGPDLLVGYINKPSILLIGDSRQQGIKDTYLGSLSGDKGTVGRAIGANFPYINEGRASLRAAEFVTTHTKFMLLAPYVSTVICEYGINDIVVNGDSAATTAASIASIRTLFAGKPFFQVTIAPETTSTDSWATVANQTPTANDSVRVTFNGLVRAGISGVTGYFEFADILESARNSSAWLSTGVANYYTVDGIHENQTMNQLYKDSNAVPKWRITR